MPMMKISKLILVALVSLSCVANAAGKPDIYSCPKFVGKNGQLDRALGIALYSGHPSELALLKPDNADTDDTGPAFWVMGSSVYDYWYVCNYSDAKLNKQFKLPKLYSRCTNIGSSKVWDRLRCQ